MIDITLLGTAATMPLPARALSSALLSCAGRSILLDCGEGTQAAARKAHVSLMKTDLIALTHYHGDHVFGLPGLLQTFSCLGRTAPLYITGPEGLEELLNPVMKLSGPLPFRILPLTLPEGGALDAVLPGWSGDAHLHAFPTNHRVPSLGYCFSLTRPGKFDPSAADALGVPPNHRGALQRRNAVTLDSGAVITPDMVLGQARKGLRVVFSGDTAPCPALTEAAAGADLLLCDATYGEDAYAAQAELYGHCTFSQAGKLAAQAGVRRLWLTHFSQIMETPEDFLPLAQAEFPDAVCGFDSLSIRLKFEER